MIQLIEWIFESSPNFWKFIGFTTILWFYIVALISIWQDRGKD